MAENYSRARRPDPRFGKFTEAEVAAGTDTGTGRGNAKLHESSGIEDLPGYRTQTIKRAYPLDTSDMMLPNEHGMEGWKGGPENLKHSLTGASAVVDNRGDGSGDGNASPYIPNH
jgi:hypothetical protein